MTDLNYSNSLVSGCITTTDTKIPDDIWQGLGGAHGLVSASSVEGWPQW